MGEIAGPGSGPPLSGSGVTPPSLSGAGRRFLSDILVELGFVDEAQADQAVEAARHPGQTPEKVLLESGTISEDQLARALAERYGLDHIDLTEFPVDESAAALLRKTAAKRYQAAPVGLRRRRRARAGRLRPRGLARAQRHRGHDEAAGAARGCGSQSDREAPRSTCLHGGARPRREPAGEHGDRAP